MAQQKEIPKTGSIWLVKSSPFQWVAVYKAERIGDFRGRTMLKRGLDGF